MEHLSRFRLMRFPVDSLPRDRRSPGAIAGGGSYPGPDEYGVLGMAVMTGLQGVLDPSRRERKRSDPGPSSDAVFEGRLRRE